MGFLGSFGSTIGGLLGLTPNNAGSQFRQSQNAALGQVGNAAANYANIAGGAGANYGSDNSNFRGAMQTEADDLSQGNSNQDRASYIANQTAPVAGAFQQGAAGLTSNLAARGLLGSGGETGALADLYTQRAGAIGTAAGNANNFFTNVQNQRNAEITGLYGGAANTDYTRQVGALGAGANLNMGIAGDYGQEAAQAQAAQAAQDAAFQNAIGGIAGDVGGIFGLNAGRASLTPGQASGGPQGPFGIGGDPSGGNRYGYTYAGY